MKQNRKLILLKCLLGAILAAVVTEIITSARQLDPVPTQKQVQQATTVPAKVLLSFPAEARIIPLVKEASLPPPPEPASSQITQPPLPSENAAFQPTPATKSPKPQKPAAQDPLARTALTMVGEVPEATEYWANAINNPDLPAEERKDLIEDLNEDGLSDPKHPGPQDVPLILNRLALIEEMAPYAMDQVNADAFAEAYKDLTDIMDGKPVR